MKRNSSLRYRVVISVWFLSIGMIYADGPGTTQVFNPAPINGIQSFPYLTYNSQDNQYLFVWLSGLSEIRIAILTSTGSQIIQEALTGVDSSSSTPAAAYNSVDNQYMVVTMGPGFYPDFTIIDALGNDVVGWTNEVPPYSYMYGRIYCCYNSVSNQYCLTWPILNTDTGISAPYFAIVNANGSLAVGATAIPNGSETLVNSATPFVSYNSQNNQYLFTWLGSSGDVLFAIYDNNGNEVVPATIIPPQGQQDASIPIFSCYNSVTNQYFVTWYINTGVGYFAIYNADGSEAVPATEIVTPNSFVQPPICSYNIRNNQYFVSWNDSNAQVICSIFDQNGNVVESDIEIPLLPHGAPGAWVFNSFSPRNDTYFVTWNGADTYFNIFTTTPFVAAPTNMSGQRTLNRFANYGEYVIQLEWMPSIAPNIVSYNIYRDGILIATLPGSATSYIVHNQPRSFMTYAVQAVNNFGDESPLVAITL